MLTYRVTSYKPSHTPLSKQLPSIFQEFNSDLYTHTKNSSIQTIDFIYKLRSRLIAPNPHKNSIHTQIPVIIRLMQRPSASGISHIYRQVLRSGSGGIRSNAKSPQCDDVFVNLHRLHPRGGGILPKMESSPCDVFINHRGIDTKRNVAGLLFHHLRRLRLRPFLDSQNMKPGDRLLDKIDAAIRECKIGVAVFSPMYCESYFCLHELSLMMETRKKIVPIFCDVKPSELRVGKCGSCPDKDLDKFRMALEEAKNTVGLTFDTSRGDWPEFLASATDAVMKNLIEFEKEENRKKKPKYHDHPSRLESFSKDHDIKL